VRKKGEKPEERETLLLTYCRSVCWSWSSFQSDVVCYLRDEKSDAGHVKCSRGTKVLHSWPLFLILSNAFQFKHFGFFSTVSEKVIIQLFYSLQAAIINYYHVGSTLCPHTDHSERFLGAPLVSISFGLPAVFLMGGSNFCAETKLIFVQIFTPELWLKFVKMFRAYMQNFFATMETFVTCYFWSNQVD